MRNTRTVEDDAQHLRELLFALGRHNSLRDPIAGAIEALAFTPAQLHAVMWLGRDSALTMGELAQRVGVTEKTITGIVDRLEREEYVVRERTGSDRRVVRVRLAARGAEAYGRLESEFLNKLRGFMALLESEDRSALFRILDKLIGRFSAGEPGAERP